MPPSHSHVNETSSIVVPATGLANESVRVLEWFVASGERVSKGQLLVEVEASKATLEIYAPSEGYVWCTADLGDEVPAGKAIGFITGSPEPPGADFMPRMGEVVHTSAEALPPARLSPLAAQLAQACGLCLADFEGGTLVRSADVLARIRRDDGSRHAFVAARQPCVNVAGVPLHWETLPSSKQVSARVLADGRAGSLQTSVTVAYPVTELLTKVTQVRRKTSATAVIIFEVARLLKQYPHLNAVYSDGRAGFYEEVNIGWALDDGEGLAVPVVRNAHQRSLKEIEEETRNFAAAYVRNCLTAKDLAGSTFTISDLCGAGVSHFTPLISRGQSGVLGVGECTLTLSFDHQLTEGRAASRFLKDLCMRLSAYSNDGASTRSELYCSLCHYGAAELKSSKAFLLRCELPAPGYVCSHCISYY